MGKREKARQRKRRRTDTKTRPKQDGTARNRPKVRVRYTSDLSILVVGDGDFTFTRGLVQHRGSAQRIVATSFDSAAAVMSKYPDAKTVIQHLKEKGATVLHDVDATELERTFGEKCRLDRIIFNFPHSGQQRVHINRNLLRSFFASARSKLRPEGEVHVTLKTLPPYSGWRIEEQAQMEGMQLVATLPFASSDFPGYKHQATLAGETFEKHAFDETKNVATFAFRIAGEPPQNTKSYTLEQYKIPCPPEDLDVQYNSEEEIEEDGQYVEQNAAALANYDIGAG